MCGFLLSLAFTCNFFFKKNMRCHVYLPFSQITSGCKMFQIVRFFLHISGEFEDVFRKFNPVIYYDYLLTFILFFLQKKRLHQKQRNWISHPTHLLVVLCQDHWALDILNLLWE
jgi:hypothetical protein